MVFFFVTMWSNWRRMINSLKLYEYPLSFEIHLKPNIRVSMEKTSYYLYCVDFDGYHINYLVINSIKSKTRTQDLTNQFGIGKASLFSSIILISLHHNLSFSSLTTTISANWLLTNLFSITMDFEITNGSTQCFWTTELSLLLLEFFFTFCFQYIMWETCASLHNCVREFHGSSMFLVMNMHVFHVSKYLKVLYLLLSKRATAKISIRKEHSIKENCKLWGFV